MPKVEPLRRDAARVTTVTGSRARRGSFALCRRRASAPYPGDRFAADVLRKHSLSAQDDRTEQDLRGAEVERLWPWTGGAGSRGRGRGGRLPGRLHQSRSGGDSPDGHRRAAVALADGIARRARRVGGRAGHGRAGWDLGAGRISGRAGKTAAAEDAGPRQHRHRHGTQRFLCRAGRFDSQSLRSARLEDPRHFHPLRQSRRRRSGADHAKPGCVRPVVRAIGRRVARRRADPHAQQRGDGAAGRTGGGTWCASGRRVMEFGRRKILSIRRRCGR